MSESTTIEWTDHTFNPWWGCARVSAGCRGCYAAAWAARWGHDVWRRKGARRLLSEANWRQPARWNRQAAAAGRPAKVFCASMADVFEIHPVADVNAQLDNARSRLWSLIEQTPWLTWQLLTKRPENVASLVPWRPTTAQAGPEIAAAARPWPSNVWIGTSVENQRWADERIPVLASIPAAVRFLSCEPLLGPVRLCRCDGAAYGIQRHPFIIHPACPLHGAERVDWVIVGGESGPRARRMDPDWARSLRDQCQAVGVPLLFKQSGSVLSREWGCTGKGSEPHEWPESFPRDFPDERVDDVRRLAGWTTEVGGDAR